MWTVLIGMHSCLARITVSQQYSTQNLREMHIRKQWSSVLYNQLLDLFCYISVRLCTSITHIHIV